MAEWPGYSRGQLNAAVEQHRQCGTRARLGARALTRTSHSQSTDLSQAAQHELLSDGNHLDVYAPPCHRKARSGPKYMSIYL